MGLFGDIFNTIMGKSTADQNLQFQKDTLQYQKDLQQQIFAREDYNRDLTFAREDNAVQRRSADLEKAGLSKTLAVGGAAATSMGNAGQAVGVTTPQNQMKWTASYDVANQVMDLMGKKQMYDQQAYNLQYAKQNGLPYGATPNSFTAISDLINKTLGKYFEGGDDSTVVANTVGDAIDYFMPSDDSDTPMEIIKDIFYPSSGKDKTPMSSDKPDFANRYMRFDKNGKPINPYRNPSAYWD